MIKLEQSENNTEPVDSNQQPIKKLDDLQKTPTQQFSESIDLCYDILLSLPNGGLCEVGSLMHINSLISLYTTYFSRKPDTLKATDEKKNPSEESWKPKTYRIIG